MIAKAACDSHRGPTASFTDTYARALADSEKISDAINTEKQAIALSTDPTQRTNFEATLKTYQAKATAPK